MRLIDNELLANKTSRFFEGPLFVLTGSDSWDRNTVLCRDLWSKTYLELQTLLMCHEITPTPGSWDMNQMCSASGQEQGCCHQHWAGWGMDFSSPAIVQRDFIKRISFAFTFLKAEVDHKRPQTYCLSAFNTWVSACPSLPSQKCIFCCSSCIIPWFSCMLGWPGRSLGQSLRFWIHCQLCSVLCWWGP